MRRSRVLTGRVPKRKDRINNDIREPEIRLIDQEGVNIGVVPTPEALKRAEAAGMDLVEVAGNSRPIVCRIMDYGDFQYQQKKKAKEAKKKQHAAEMKEVKLRPRIGEHDYGFKLKHAREFLLEGDKVRFVVMFRGRERTHLEYGYKLLERVATELEFLANIDAKAQMEGRNMVMSMNPDGQRVKAEKARLERERRELLEQEKMEPQVEAEVTKVAATEVAEPEAPVVEEAIEPESVEESVEVTADSE